MSERTELFDGKCNTRGGGYKNAANYLAISETVLTPPNGKDGSLGFRLARTIGDDNHEDIVIEENENKENESGDGDGYFKFNGTKYEITSGVIKNYNMVGMKLLEVHLFSEDIEPNSENNGGLSGTGWMMDIGLHCTDEDLQDGKTYTEENCMMITMGAMVNVNTDIFPWEAENGFIGYVEYTLEVSKEGDEYTLTFSCKGSDYSFENNRLEFEGEYKGELPVLTAGIDF